MILAICIRARQAEVRQARLKLKCAKWSFVDMSVQLQQAVLPVTGRRCIHSVDSLCSAAPHP